MKLFTALAALALLTKLSIAGAAPSITVSAAASLKGALSKVKALHARAHPDVRVIFNFGGSGTLQQQLEAGAPVDLFISAAARQMDELEAKGLLLPGTRRDLLTNTLVLITPAVEQEITSFADLAQPAIQRIAIGDPKSVPAGEYAAAVFAKLGITGAVAPKLVRMLDAGQVLTTVATGNVPAGVVYATDARLSRKVRVAAIAPASSHPRIIYPAAVLRDTKQADAARTFLAFLSSEPVRAVFEEFGFAAVR